MFYQINNNYPVISPILLDGFQEYTVGQEPLELQQCIANLEAQEAFTKLIADWKSNRQNEVNNIEITLDGVIYQGDEESQTRMSRAIVALPDDVITVSWVAKDNTSHDLNRVQLRSLLLQAGGTQSAIWNLNRPGAV